MDLSIPLLLYTGARKLRGGIPLATNRLLVMQRTFTTLHLEDARIPTREEFFFWTDSRLENWRFDSRRMS